MKDNVTFTLEYIFGKQTCKTTDCKTYEISFLANKGM
jgi:hypothetical protein